MSISCFIIGAGTLPIQCAELLLDRGYEIYGIISADVSLIQWAQGKNIPHTRPTDDLVAFVGQQPFDYLFSIVNEHLLPTEILELPRKCAVNYHDAPLPRYAGSHATSWALMNRETAHGITWHVVSKLVDAGDILKQVAIDIADGETALTLNAKCYEAAIRAFAELIDDLACDRVSARKQDLDKRTFFARYKRPPVGGVFSWSRDAYDISALVRALDFGPYPNPLGLPKFSIGTDFIAVREIDVVDATSGTPPGTVAGIDAYSLRVFATGREVVLRKLQTVDGQPLSIPDVVARYGLREGYQFKDLDPETADRITAYNELVARHEAFWVERLATLQPFAPPFAFQNVSHGETARYASVSVPIPQAVMLLLQGRTVAWNLKDFLLAAMAAYLARIGGVDCFDVGFRDVESQRDLAGLEGLFAAVVPLRFAASMEQSFEEIIHTVQAEVALVRRHKTFMRDIVARYPALRSVSELQRGHTFAVIVEQVETLDNYEAMPGSEFTLVIADEQAECRWIYDAKIIDGDMLTRMLGHFATFLQGIAADPGRRIADLPLLTEQERHQLLEEFNNTKVDYPRDTCIHRLFEAQVERTPDAVAAIFEDQQLTYRELNTRANQLAHYLSKRGVGPEVLVAICVERSLNLVIGLLGILKAGGAYVPLDPKYPPERLDFMLEDARSPLLLTQQQLLNNLPHHGIQAVYLDEDWEAIAEESKENFDSGVMADHLAYVIYTSGSTGRPKGVQILHRALVNHNIGVIKNYGLQPNDRVLQFASISFDVAAEELFPTWLSGAAVVLRPDGIITSLAEFLRFVAQERLTVLNLPTSYWHEWVFELSRSAAQLPPTLRLVIAGSEKALPDQLTTWQKLVGDRIGWRNAYGLTETTITSTIYEPPSYQAKREFHTVPIGRPIANMQIYILDAHLQPVPIGTPGELHIGGDSLARGYLNRPELSAEKFIQNPFSDEPNARLYRTGDVARWLPDGNIELLGRVDHQMKLRGFRIEPGEIETALNHHSLVRESVVIAREDQPSEQRLVAYLVPKGKDGQIELWPSPGDYQIWDEALYYAMTHDKLRVEHYKAAINRSVKDKVVVDIGTGKDLVLTRLSLDAGAKKVYAIEANDRAYEQAKQLTERLGVQDKVFLVHGDSTTVQLPERVDVCVSELVGAIGGSEGVVSVLNDARRFLKQGGLMIPQRSITNIAAVCLPDEFVNDPRFTEISGDYARKIFDKVGHKFDFRVCINNFPRSNIISSVEIFEDLDFSSNVNPVYERPVTLTINKDARLAGFLLWLNLYTIDGEIIDNLADKYSWLPVYFPVLSGIEVSAGDVIKATCTGWLSEDNVNPDYKIQGRLFRRNGETIDFEHNSLLYGKEYQGNTFYARLFSGDEVRIRPDPRIELSTQNLRKYLEEWLPPYMLPSQFLVIEELPRTPSGKVDRKALPAPDRNRPELEATYVAPRTPTEETLANFWMEVLGIERIGVHDNFFELGGHSLLATRVILRIQETFTLEMSLQTLFEAATIAELAERIEAIRWITHHPGTEPSLITSNREETDL